MHTCEFCKCVQQQQQQQHSWPAMLQCCCFNSSNNQYAPIHKKRLTHAENYHRPSRTIHTQTHTLAGLRLPFCTFFLTLGADTSRPERVGAFCGVLAPTARRCAKNSPATIGIINIACPIPLHTSRPLRRYKSDGYFQTQAALILETEQKHA